MTLSTCDNSGGVPNPPYACPAVLRLCPRQGASLSASLGAPASILLPHMMLINKFSTQPLSTSGGAQPATAPLLLVGFWFSGWSFAQSNEPEAPTWPAMASRVDCPHLCSLPHSWKTPTVTCGKTACDARRFFQETQLTRHRVRLSTMPELSVGLLLTKRFFSK